MKSNIKIGRDNSNDIRINEPRISRSHAIITKIGDELFEVKDLGSTNGTYVNGMRISQSQLLPNDRLEVAGFIVDWYPAFLTDSEKNYPNTVKEEPYSKVREVVTIGSSSDNEIILEHDFVSKHHARLSRLKNGDYFIEDLGSTNGTYVNGMRVISKNFSKTDLIKIAYSDLPIDWFKNRKLRNNFIRDHKKAVLFALTFFLIFSLGILYYFFSCEWLNCGCTLSQEQVSKQCRTGMVFIDHSYYYTIKFHNQNYYVGRNKIFNVIEANPSKDNLLPYNSIVGCGAFVKDDGTIITSVKIVNPWLDNVEQIKMLKEVVLSKTIKRFSLDKDFDVCGVSCVLRFLPVGAVTNDQNFIAASSTVSCSLNDTNYYVQSVKNCLPESAESLRIATISKNKLVDIAMKSYYVGSLLEPARNQVLVDTFYSVRDSFDLRKVIIPFNYSQIPALPVGSIVLNDKGEIIGILENNRIIFKHLIK